MKAEYTAIEYVPVAGANAPSHQRYAVTDQMKKQNDFFLQSTCLPSDPSNRTGCIYRVATGTATSNRVILLYGAAGVPGGGETPMALIRYQPFDGSLKGLPFIPRDCVANMGHITLGTTARFTSGSCLLHIQRKGGYVT